ncbi:MAG TPA: hemolysin family protein [Ideonella sp.]|uniref:hemolysin family protein n=1 Tax=Ideonella sp. TaxID=1929293 RepID=UPI002C8FD487|nr:hemolysin family protein [Ideonella sp.]HSI48019.1 hemolysin family protein [Ideonella sp.]
MDLVASLLLIALLIAASAFFSVAEIAMAAARRLKLRQLADLGEHRATQVLAVQDAPGHYVTVVQIGLNTIAILAGIVGDGALTPHFAAALRWAGVGDERLGGLALALSFLTVTVLFVLLADLLPKRVGMNDPERLAMRLVGPMLWLSALFKPVVWTFTRAADGLSKLFGLPQTRDDRITHHDILALTAAGTLTGAVHSSEQQIIENVFELDTRTVESAMTSRERVVWLAMDDDEVLLRTRVADDPHSTYLVCGESIDEVIGYVDATDMFARVLREEPIGLRACGDSGLIKKVLIVPDRLTLAEMLTQFRQAHEDFAVIVNEYSLVVGVITLNDVMSTVMGAMVAPHDEEQIIRRDDGSFLADGVTPIPDLERALDIAEWPHAGQYDTLAGFLMVMLRRIPKRTDTVTWEGWRFEVMDVDRHRVDQVMIARVA